MFEVKTTATTTTPNYSDTEKLKFEILPEDFTNFDLSFKLIVIGDSCVGKSCQTNNAVKNTFDKSYNTTVGFEFFTFIVKTNNKIVKL